MSADAAMNALETACAAAGIDLDKKYDRKTRRDSYRAAIDRYELCRLALPVIFALKIISDSKLKYARCAIMLASEQTRYTGVQALCADAVRATCGVKRDTHTSWSQSQSQPPKPLARQKLCVCSTNGWRTSGARGTRADLR